MPCNAPGAATLGGRPTGSQLRYLQLPGFVGDYLQLATRVPATRQHWIQGAGHRQRAGRYRQHRMAAMLPETGSPGAVHREPGPGPPAQRATGQLLHRHRDIQSGDPAQLLGHHVPFELTLQLWVGVLEIATTTTAGSRGRTRRRHPAGHRFEHCHRVSPAEGSATVLGDHRADPLPRQRVPDEHHPTPVAGHAEPTMAHRSDGELQFSELEFRGNHGWSTCRGCGLVAPSTGTPPSDTTSTGVTFPEVPAGPVPKPQRTAPGASCSRWTTRADERSCQGTLVTITPGSNSNRPLIRSALWLCRICSHQWPTTYSGMNTVTTQRGLSERARLT